MDIKRDITIQAQAHLESDETLVFVGARQTGKTTILHQLENFIKLDEKPCYFLNLEDPDYLLLLNQSPKNIFKIFTFDQKQKSFLFIDEIQYLKNPTNFLKYIFDEFRGVIKIIASGSSSFYIDKKFKDSLVGRKIIYEVPTLSFREFLRFKNEDKLSICDLKALGLSDKDKISRYYAEYALYGGYPRVVLGEQTEKERILEDITYSYIKKDVFEAGIKQEDLYFKLLKILASQIGELVNSFELANTLGVSKTAIDNYLYVAQKSFVVRLVKPYFRNLRKELTKMPKVYFMDTGLRNYLVRDLGGYEERLDKGQLLENLVYRQLSEIYKSDDINFWRTTAGAEVDFVVEGKKAYEVKADPRNFREKKYKAFFEAYPELKLTTVSLNIKPDTENMKNVLEVWRL